MESKVRTLLKIFMLTIMSCLIATPADCRTMSRFDLMLTTEAALDEDAAFEEADYVHTLRTIDHMLREQKAEVACLLVLTSNETKHLFVSPPYTDVQRALLHQLTAISLLPADHPIRTRYISHLYYIYTLERILI